MRLLLCTQILDRTDPILGFFHEWVRECALQCESVEVICLKEGVHDLPKNVRVHSLGKERGAPRFLRYIHFYQYVIGLRNKYDAVFVHMIPEYAVLGGPVWSAHRIPVGMWYAHGAVSRMLKIAVFFCSYVFTSTSQGFRLSSPKAVVVGQGIDCELFSFVARERHAPVRMVTVGRISRSKKLEVLLRATALLVAKGADVACTLVGVAVTPGDHVYEAELRALARELGIEERVMFHGAVANAQLPKILHESAIFIHAGATGSLDKTLLESLATGLPTISSNDAYPGIVGKYASALTYAAGDADALAEKVLALLGDDERVVRERQEELRHIVETEHGLRRLITTILSHYPITHHI